LYRPDHQDAITTVFVIAGHPPHFAKAERAVELAARGVARADHQLGAPDAASGENAQSMAHKSLSHAALPEIGMHGERYDLGIGFLHASGDVCGDSTAQFADQEKIWAVLV